MVIPAQPRAAGFDGGPREQISVDREYQEGRHHPGERLQQGHRIWSEVTEKISEESFQGDAGRSIKAAGDQPSYMMADSGARGSKQQMRPARRDAGGSWPSLPGRSSRPSHSKFREGLNVLHTSSPRTAARKGLADTASRPADPATSPAGWWTSPRTLIILGGHCQTIDGI